MNSNSNPVLKRLKTETSSKDDNKSSSPEEALDGSASGGSSQVTNSDEDGVGTFANIFTDDILPDIFDNQEILKAKDLLTFRLVNRCWRDAATGVLLKRNMCQITLHFNKVEIDENDVCFGWAAGRETYDSPHPRGNLTFPPDDYEYFHYYQCRNFLSDLNDLISTSPKFPCNSICFDEMALFGFGTLCPRPPTDFTTSKYWPQYDLFRFFNLHGKKIKKLSLGGKISREAMHKLLYVYMPRLSCIDLAKYVLTEEDDDDNKSEFRVFLPPPSTLEIKKIVWPCEDNGYWGHYLERGLISASPNLSSITRVTIDGLVLLLQIGKSHLIQDLELETNCRMHILAILEFTKLLVDSNLTKANNDTVPRFKLRKLSVTYSTFKNFNEKYNVLVKAVNIILSGSKDTLEYLELYITPSDSLVNIFIPPLPRLESLRVFSTCHEEGLFNTKIHFRGDIIGKALQAGEITVDQNIVNDVNSLALENHGSWNIPAKYFPRLRKVKMLTSDMKYEPHKLMGIFSIENLGPSSSVTAPPSDTFVTVTTLRCEIYSQQSLYCNINMSKLFPNLVHLKIVFIKSSYFPNWVWTFPKLETCEMSPQTEQNTNIVDSFFTGFSEEFCAAFECDDALSSELEPSSAKVFERTRPYIGNCKNLKELKIKIFKKLNSKFASKLTALCGFQDIIPRTKILFCFCACLISKEEIQESSQYLDSIAAYIEIKEF